MVVKLRSWSDNQEENFLDLYSTVNIFKDHHHSLMLPSDTRKRIPPTVEVITRKGMGCVAPQRVFTLE